MFTSSHGDLETLIHNHHELVILQFKWHTCIRYLWYCEYIRIEMYCVESKHYFSQILVYYKGKQSRRNWGMSVSSFQHSASCMYVLHKKCFAIMMLSILWPTYVFLKMFCPICLYWLILPLNAKIWYTFIPCNLRHWDNSLARQIFKLN